MTLDRWPNIDEVRANYLSKGTGWAYAVVKGFSDYGPVVAEFYVVRALTSGQVDEVWVKLPGWQLGCSIRQVDQQDGFTLEFLCRRGLVERVEADGIHSCHQNCQRPACVLRRKLSSTQDTLQALINALATYGDGKSMQHPRVSIAINQAHSALKNSKP